MKLRTILALFLGAMLSMMLAGSPVWAANCGDTAGPSGERVPCACGDTVITNTTLKGTDPVVSTDPGDFCASTGLAMGAADIKLDCKGLTLRGNGLGDGIVIFADGTTVQGCVITNFSGFAGIHVDAGNTTLVLNKLIANLNAGIGFHFETGNRAERNQADGNGCWGITVNFSADSAVVTGNRAAGNGCGGILVDTGSDTNTLAANITDDNSGPGIEVRGDSNTLDGNRGKDNTADGVLVSGATNTLIRNVFDTNGGHGICAGAGNIDGGGNRGTGNAVLPDVDFACP